MRFAEKTMGEVAIPQAISDSTRFCVLCHLLTTNAVDLQYCDNIGIRVPICDECRMSLDEQQSKWESPSEDKQP